MKTMLREKEMALESYKHGEFVKKRNSKGLVSFLLRLR